MEETGNIIHLRGQICQSLQFGHELFGEQFYVTTLRVPRLSGAEEAPFAVSVLSCAAAEVSQAAGIISIGTAAPYSCRRSATVVGIKCSAAVLSTTKFTISSLAISGVGLFACRPRIASRPSGVAALPRPSKFAVIFMDTAFIAGSSFLKFGNKSRSRGDSIRLTVAVKPEALAISISPPHRQSAPRSLMHRVTASDAPAITALESACIFPCHAADRKAKSIMPAQI